ncbi:MAG: aspartate kinase [Halobacteriales archaeon]
MRLVVKFGGTSLASGERVERAAGSIADAVEQGHEVAVVASAMGSSTDDLIENITFDADKPDRAEIVSMGERTSVRMLKAALASLGINADFFEPGTHEWPIVVDKHGEVDRQETARRIDSIKDRLETVVPVVTGFLAEDHEANVTTLGRGGSDTTAVMLGQYINADEVVIVTDVEGVMTGDPRVVEGARNVGEITVDELRSLSFRGAEVVAPSALAYKSEDLEMRVVHYQHGDLLTGGTDVVGEFASLIDMRERPLACITVAGRAVRNRPGILAKLSTALYDAGINIDATSSGLDSITIYVDQADAEDAEAALHDTVVDSTVLSSFTVEDSIAAIRITSGDLPTNVAELMDVVEPLAEEYIDLYDIVTSATTVAVFVDESEAERTLELIQNRLE